MSNSIFRLASVDDIDELWQLIEESLTGFETRLTRASLLEDMSGHRKLNTNSLLEEDDPSIELDLDLAQVTYPLCQILIAQLKDEFVGYIMFHQFYSPWKGRKACIDYLYVKPAHRNKRIASGLVQNFKEFCRTGNLNYIVTDTSRIDSRLIDTSIRYGFKTFRDNNTDWSVYRIDL